MKISSNSIEERMFQFLIGSLETFFSAFNTKYGLGFQFLIGSLETFIPKLPSITFKEFQFLIGSLETK